MTKRTLCLYPWLSLGGADKFNLDMLRWLTTRGWQATIVTTLPSTHPWRDEFARLSERIIDLTIYPAEEHPARMLHIAASAPFDYIFISHSTLGYHLLPYLRAHLPHLSFVDYCHMELPEENGGYPGQSLAYASRLDLQIVSSQHLKGWMIERGGDPSRIAVCTTNIDTDDWRSDRYDRAALRAALDIPLDTPVALYAARLERQKQPMLAMEIMRRVATQMPDAMFLIAGDGQFAPFVRGFIQANDLERQVRMLGPQPNARVRELLAISDIFLLPSEMEGISLAIYEAMAMGVVPISAAVGGQAELVAPECGVLVERGPGEREKYVAALLDLIRDPARLRRMGQASRDHIDARFRLDQMGLRMEELLANARYLHDTLPRPVPTLEAALASARAAVTAARATALETRRVDQPMRRLARSLYWRAVEHGAWWLVPLLERLRRGKGVLKAKG